MSQDRNSFSSAPLTFDGLWKIIVGVSVVVASTATAVHMIWPPSLSFDDSEILKRVSAQLGEKADREKTVLKAVQDAQQDVRCFTVEVGAQLDAADDNGPGVSTIARKAHRYSVVTSALHDATGCRDRLPTFTKQ